MGVGVKAGDQAGPIGRQAAVHCAELLNTLVLVAKLNDSVWVKSYVVGEKARVMYKATDSGW